MANAKFRVIVKKSGSSARAVIRPPFDVATKAGNGQLELRNKTTADILVALPGGIFGNGAQPDPAQNIPVAPGNLLTRPVHPQGAEGIHDFRVFCIETFSFADANSDPEIIIE